MYPFHSHFIFIFLTIVRLGLSNSIENVDYCAIMVYKYGEDKPEDLDTVYHKSDSVNIGDYIQSIASIHFCDGKKIIYIDRDYIEYYFGPKVKLIMNGWWHLHNSTFYPSENISPLYISFHINNQDIKLKHQILKLKRYEPIGCRDISTMNYLNSIGVKAYFSGCLTLTLGLSYHNYANRIHDKILCLSNCDNCRDGNVIWEFLKEKVLKYYNFTKTIYLDKNYNRYTTHYDRFNEGNRFLKIYEKSTLVITQNLHTLLPCIAMNAPVIYVSPHYPDYRFTGYLDSINYVYITSDNGKYYLRHSVSISNTSVYNPNNFSNVANSLIKNVKEYMKQ